MKRFLRCAVICLFVAGWAVGRLSAQNFDIRVTDSWQMPVPYAFVILNGVPVAVTDTDGLATVNFSRLRLGHTLAAQCLGLEKSSVVIDARMMEEGRCEFTLRPSAGYIVDTSHVESASSDIQRIFEETSQNVIALDYNCTVSGSFDFEYRGDKARGSFSVRNEVDGKGLKYFREKGWCHHPVVFETGSDTVRFSHKLHEAVHYAFSELNYAVAAIGHDRHFYKYRPEYALLGRDSVSGTVLFRINLPRLSTKAVQILLHVDPDDGAIERMEISVFQFGTALVKRIVADMESAEPLRKMKVPVLRPLTVEYDYANRYSDMWLKMTGLQYQTETAGRR